MLRDSGRYAEAEALLLPSYRTLQAEHGALDLYTRFALRRLMRLYEVWSRPDEAAR